MTIAGLWRYGDWRHVATGCSALVVREDGSGRYHFRFVGVRVIDGGLLTVVDEQRHDLDVTVQLDTDMHQ